MPDTDASVTPVLLYLHGFQSSSKSLKAMQMAEYLHRCRPDIELIAPTLPNYPQEAAEFIDSVIEQNLGKCATRQMGIVGSSLGGFLALYAASRHGLRAVMVNPSVYPFRTIGEYLGENENPYTGIKFTLTDQHMHELRAMLVDLQPHEYQNFLLLLQTGDETLDFSEAVERFPRLRTVIEYGGDHSFTSFDRWLPEIVGFLRL